MFLANVEKRNTSSIKSAILSVLLAFMLALSFTSIAEAKTLFTYSGTHIIDKESIKTATLSKGKTCKVRHTQKREYASGGANLLVEVQRKAGKFTWKTVGSRTFSNDVSGVTFSTYCSKGTYRLHFKASGVINRFSINGSFYC